MFYDLKRDPERILTLEEVERGEIVAGYLSLEEFRECYARLGFSALSLQECERSREAGRNCLNVLDDYSFGTATIVQYQGRGQEHSLDKLAFYVRKNLFLVVCLKDADGSSLAMFHQVRTRKFQSISLEKIIYFYLEGLLQGDSQLLGALEEEISALEERLLGPEGGRGPELNRRIFAVKKELAAFRNYYGQLVDLGEDLCENGNDLFPEDDLRYFRMFANKAARLRDSTGALLEQTVHLREAYDAALELNLNRTMTIFTVATTIFLPLSLITGWYGMNFTHMPELNWRWGYCAVICASIIIVAGCIWFFRKKKLL